jgi:hypothetical protein
MHVPLYEIGLSQKLVSLQISGYFGTQHVFSSFIVSIAVMGFYYETYYEAIT